MEKDIIISINAGNGVVYKSAEALGINGENINGQIIVEFFNGDFVDGSGNLEIEKADGTKGYFAMTKDKETKTYRLDICSGLLDVTGKINCQVHITQTKKGGEIPVFKSVIFGLDVIAAIGATAEIQADRPDWCDTVDSRLEALENGGGGSIEIVQTTGTSTTAVMSQKATTNEINVLKSDITDLQAALIGVSDLIGGDA